VCGGGESSGSGASGLTPNAVRSSAFFFHQLNYSVDERKKKPCCRGAPHYQTTELQDHTTATAAASTTAPGAPNLAAFELQTAAGTQQAVLPGIMQRRVLQAAEQLGLRVRRAAPRGVERGAWREAFIANW